MPVVMTRGIQVPLPFPDYLSPGVPRRQARPGWPSRRTRPATLSRRAQTLRHGCPDCRGPLAAGEGFVTCVVCGLRRAA